MIALKISYDKSKQAFVFLSCNIIEWSQLCWYQLLTRQIYKIYIFGILFSSIPVISFDYDFLQVWDP